MEYIESENFTVYFDADNNMNLYLNNALDQDILKNICDDCFQI